LASTRLGEPVRTRVFRIVPMITIHYAFGGLGKLLDEAQARGRSPEDGVDTLRSDTLLLRRPRHQHELAVVLQRDDEIGLQGHCQRTLKIQSSPSTRGPKWYKTPEGAAAEGR
jgi:hypothetical protein